MRKKFVREFRKQLRLGITAAVGFSVAYSWRMPILRLGNDFSRAILGVEGDYSVDFSTAVIFTFLGVLIIWWTSKLLKD